MNFEHLLISVTPLVLATAIVFFWARRQRAPMEKRAGDLLKLHPNAERTSIYLALRSTLAGAKQQEIDNKVAEMNQAGWIVLRATMASPLRTLSSWGGGVMLHFIRDDRHPSAT